MQQIKSVKGWVEPFDSIGGRIESARELEEMLQAEPDAEMCVRARPRSVGAGAGDRGVPASLAARRARRPPRRAARDQRGRRRHRGAGLGVDAHAHVHAVGRAKGLRHRDPRHERRRRGGHQGRGARDQGHVRLRISQGRDRRAPARAHLAVRRAGAAAHELRVGVRVSGRERRDQHRDPRRGHQDGRLPRVGGRRTAREQDQLRGATHAHPDRASSCRRSRSARSTRTRARR